MSKLMKIKDLKNYGIPSYFIKIWEKNNSPYLLPLKYPKLLDDVSLVIIDEVQAINHPKWGPLLEDIIEHLHKKDLTNSLKKL